MVFAPIMGNPTSRTAPDGAAYRAYLLTSEWRQTRNAKLRKAGYRCEVCGSKRALQVHHLSYERLGAERDEDLQVLCAGCHEDQHPKEATHDYVRLYVVVAEEVIKHFGGSFENISDFSEALKQQCALLKIPYNADRLTRALRVVYQKHPNLFVPPPVQAFIEQTEERPPSQEEARLILRSLGVYEATRAHQMPDARVLTMRQYEVLRAKKLIAEAMVDSIERCEELERAVGCESSQDDDSER